MATIPEGFKLVEEHFLDDINSEASLYRHELTGALVLYLKNDDPNKAFTIAFKTPPYDDNGVAHITEHSVLNGSEKYPSKEPFVELIKGSLNTFVNAMTFSDKTIYPVASTNQKDFSNLVSVYLDAVFKPKFYENTQILQQEGWHYHLPNESDDLIYKGVVYNEMKGALASAEAKLEQIKGKALYPETIYRHESGGTPASIPTLTQEKFVDFHSKYYHPSNSLTILYGDLDAENAFGQLSEYFDNFTQKDPITFEVKPEQKAHEPVLVDETYSITEGESVAKKAYLTKAWHVTTADHQKEVVALDILEEILLGSTSAPLKKALLNAGIGGDVYGGHDEVGYVHPFEVTLKYTDVDKVNQFEEIIHDVFSSLVTDGIPDDLVTAAINKLSFKLKETVISESFPRGVIYGITSLGSWLYGESPFEALSFTSVIDELKADAKDGYFETLIKDKLLDNTHTTTIKLAPEPGKSDRLEKELLEKLKDYKNKLSRDELEGLVKQTETLIKRQQTPDKPEDLAKIPTLEKSDLSASVADIPLEIDTIDDRQTYLVPLFTSGIDYTSLYFDISDLSNEDISTISLLSDVLGELPTAKHSVAQLHTAVDISTGGIRTAVKVVSQTDGTYKPYFVVKGKSLSEYATKLVDLIQEIILTTEFDHKSNILEVIHSIISGFEQKVNYRAHIVSAQRAVSHLLSGVKYQEAVSGIDYYYYLKKLLSDLEDDQAFSQSVKKFEDLAHTIFSRSKVFFTFTGSNEQYDAIKPKLNELLTSFATLPLKDSSEPISVTAKKEAFKCSQDVNYVAKAGLFKAFTPYSGQLRVLSNVIDFDYLWNTIRVQGGAYGCFNQVTRNGVFTLASYRDPNIKETFEAYNKLPDYISKLTLKEPDVLKYIIGALSTLDRPLSAADQGELAINMALTNMTYNDRVELRQEVLSTTSDDLVQLADALGHTLDESSAVVVGNAAKIEDNKELFDDVLTLF
ncbi:insulinase family protein [Bavariicoccus seileri]|uniref:insulinase family protein n=1 Tax=Bavariicoccus seileri TaxID=549685 RepID=UPI003F91BDB7